MSPTYRHEAEFPHSLDRLGAYYESPGTVSRLTPDWTATVLKEPRSLAEGQRTELLFGPPWAPSLGPVDPGLRWVAEHTAHTPGRGFVDEMVSGPLRSWRHEHRFDDAAPATDAPASRVRDTVEWEAPLTASVPDRPRALGAVRAFGEERVERQIRRMFEFRTRQTAADLDFHRLLEQRGEPGPKTFVISGASGMVGTALSALLRSGGHRVIALSRSAPEGEDAPGVRTVVWDPAEGRLDPQELIGADAVINLAGASLMGRFTEEHRRAVRSSRIQATRTLVRAMGEVAEQGGPRVLVSASASGYYGHDAGEVTESSPSGEDFLASVCRDWETEALAAREHGIRVALVRTGLVLSARGGLLGAQLPLYLAGGGGPMGGGRMWQPWIGLEDLIRIYAFAAVTPEAEGPINAAAPHPVRQEEFATTLASVLHRPAVIPAPAAAPAVLLGRQGARELALSSAKLSPDALRALDFPFRHPRLREALEHTLGHARGAE